MNINIKLPKIPEYINFNKKDKIIILLSEIINSMIVLFVPDSKKLFKKFILTHKLKLDYKNTNYNDLISIYLRFLSLPGNNFIQKILYSLGPDSSISYYYVKIKINFTEISQFKLSNLKELGVEPKDIILSSSTSLFGIEYVFDDFNFKKNIKIQETFKNFKLNSIYLKIKKYYSIIKIENIWYIFDDEIGLKLIPFTITKNIIVFGSVQLKNLFFTFDKIENCIIFYLKDTSSILSNVNTSSILSNEKNIIPKKEIQKSEKKIKIFKNKDGDLILNTECDCTKDLGWRQLSGQFCMSHGICWFDAGMMALLIPIKLRKIFLDKFHEKYHIPKDKLFPCVEHFDTPDKETFVKTLTTIDTKKQSSTTYTVPRVLFSALDIDHNKIPLYLLKDKDDFNKIKFDSNIFSNDLKYYYSRINGYKDFDLSYNFFLISLKRGYFEHPKNSLLGFCLQSILIAFNLRNDPKKKHAIAFIKCKNGWYLYDDNLPVRNKNMVKLNVSKNNGCLIFDSVQYVYNKVDYINVDLFNTNSLIYCYAK